MRKTITAETVVVFKEGIGANNKSWTLSNVVDGDGVKYSTFEPINEGSTYDVEIVQETSTKINPRSGKPYLNLKITKIYPAKGSPKFGTHTADAEFEERTINVSGIGPKAPTQLDRIEDKLDKIAQHIF